jgi:hypothetical protein
MPQIPDGMYVHQVEWDRLLQSLPSSYTVWKDGANYRGECNISGGDDIPANASLEAVVQNSFDGLSGTHPEVVALRGDLTVDDTLEVPLYAVLNMYGAKLTAANGLNKSMISLVGSTHISLLGGMLDGNKGNQTVNCDIIKTDPTVPSGRFYIGYGMKIQNAKRFGIYLVGTLGKNVGTVYLTDIDVEDCGSTGILLSDYTADCNLHGLNLGGNTGIGMQFNGTGGNSIDNCLFWNNQSGLNVYASSNNMFTGCRFDWNSYNGMSIQEGSNGNIFSTCTAFDNCQLDGTYACVVVTDSKHNQFVGNHFWNAAAVYMKYGIQETGTTDYTILRSNNFYGPEGFTYSTAPMLLIGGHTSACDNPGYNPRGNIATPWANAATGYLSDTAGALDNPVTDALYTVSCSPKLIILTDCGGISAVQIDGVTLTGITIHDPQIYQLNPGQTLHVVWAGTTPHGEVYAQ